MLDNNLGKLRTTPVNIGGTNWKPMFPIESQIKEELDEILNQKDKTKTEIAIEIMLWIMRGQMFIDNGCGIITIAQENQPMFYEKLIKYYETGDNKDLKEWLYETSIDGINL